MRKKTLRASCEPCLCSVRIIPTFAWSFAATATQVMLRHCSGLRTNWGSGRRLPGQVAYRVVTRRMPLPRGDLFVLPSYSENFGISVVEALAAGLPCILGEGVAIAGEVAAAGAGVTVSTQPESIAQGVRRYVQDPDGLRQASERARALAADQYSASVMGERLVELYRKIADGRRAA